MQYLDPIIKNRIERKLNRLQKLRPLPASAVRKLREQFQLEMTYNSNAIEGNSLTLKETFLVINEGITIKGKPLKDHLEAKDHQEALEFVYELVQPRKKPTISENLIRSLHQLVMKKTDEEWAGRYRASKVIIAGADHVPPLATRIPLEMKKIIQWISREQKKLHIIELAAILHHKLVYVHPFIDGNGRTARLLMNIFLLRQGYPLVIILKNERNKYYRVLEEADKGNYLPLVRFIAQSTERSLDIYLDNLSPAQKKQELFLSLSQVGKKFGFSGKYLNLLASNGKLEARKKGRNWLTSVEAVERYLKNRQRKRE